jgi:hypothetical protein
VHDHPDDESEQQRRPDPAERGQRGGARRDRDERSAGEGHRCGRDRCPPLRAVGEARRQHGQERPTDGEPEQDRPGDHGLAAARERAEHKPDRGDQAGEQRARHDQH